MNRLRAWPARFGATLLLAAGTAMLAGCGAGAGTGSTSFSGMDLRASGNLVTAGQDQYAAPASAQAATPAVVEPAPTFSLF